MSEIETMIRKNGLAVTLCDLANEISRHADICRDPQYAADIRAVGSLVLSAANKAHDAKKEHNGRAKKK